MYFLRGDIMKKILIVLIFALLLAFPLTANVLQDSDFSVGVGAGAGATFATGRLDFDRTMSAVLNVGFGYWGTRGFYLRPQFQYAISELEFDIDLLRFYPYVAVAAPVGFSGLGVDLGVSAGAGLSYYFQDVPLEIFGEWLFLGFNFLERSKSDFGYNPTGASIGVRWMLGR